VLTVISDSADRDGSTATAGSASSVIDELVREGARRMLAEALRAEVDAYVARFADERDDNGRRLVVRNGHHEPRDVVTSAGAVEVHAPRVNDKRIDSETGERQRFCSAILPPWARKTPKIGEVLPLLYLHGLSSGDFVPALGQFLGSAKGLSSSTITKLTETWKAEQRAFADRDLSGVDYVYLWADGIHVNIRLEEDKLCLLVMIGVRADGRKELVALADGYRESAGSWADLLRDCKRRGMRAPVLAVGDGALGFWGALREVFPDTREQRCWFHKLSNVLAVLPKSAHPGAKKALAEIWNAEDKRTARPRRREGVRGSLRREISQGGRQDHRRPRQAARVLRLPGRALDPFAHHESHRIDLRDRAQPQQDHQRSGLPCRRTRNGVQAHRGRPVTLARRKRATPGRARPSRREVRKRQTRRTPRRHDH
jgi:transposase-like protein